MNYAFSRGGGAYLSTSADAKFSNSFISHNYAERGPGGGILLEDIAVLKLDNSTISVSITFFNL